LDYDTTSQTETKRVSDEEVLKKLEKSVAKSKKSPPSEDEDDDDTLSYFQKLADS